MNITVTIYYRDFRFFGWLVIICAILSGIPIRAAEPDWDSLAYTPISQMQSINGNGTPAWSVPIVQPDDQQAYKLRGVVLNNPGVMLNCDPDYQEGPMWYMGGQWQIFVQAVACSGDATNNPELVGDFGGVAVWMGQNYGNHEWYYGYWSYNYSDEEWLAEVNRVNLPIDTSTGNPTTEPLRPGDLIEIHARGGLHYKGKFNVNEQHDNDPALDFDIFILERGLELPVAEICLDDIKNSDDTFIVDVTRAQGGEFYQGQNLVLQGVRITNPEQWGQIDPEKGQLYIINVTDGVRNFDIKLGENSLFDGTTAPEGLLDISGIGDQDSWDLLGGYRMWALAPQDFTASAWICGDASLDGVVDGLDASILAAHWLNSSGVTWKEGDFNGDGKVNEIDASLLAANWSPTDASASVPEPGALLLIILGGLTAVVIRKRQLTV